MAPDVGDNFDPCTVEGDDQGTNRSGSSRVDGDPGNRHLLRPTAAIVWVSATLASRPTSESARPSEPSGVPGLGASRSRSTGIGRALGPPSLAQPGWFSGTSSVCVCEDVFPTPRFEFQNPVNLYLCRAIALSSKQSVVAIWGRKERQRTTRR